MTKNTTTYTVLNAEGVLGEGFTKKAKAIALADESRGTTLVEVVTSTGKVVHSVPPIKRIRMSKPYTRVVSLPEGFVLPEGKRACYTKARKGMIVLHDFEAGDYSVVNFKTGAVIADGLATTRDAGRFTTDTPVPA